MILFKENSQVYVLHVTQTMMVLAKRKYFKHVIFHFCLNIFLFTYLHHIFNISGILDDFFYGRQHLFFTGILCCHELSTPFSEKVQLHSEKFSTNFKQILLLILNILQCLIECSYPTSHNEICFNLYILDCADPCC